VKSKATGNSRSGIPGNLATQKFPREFPGILGIAICNFFLYKNSATSTLQLYYNQWNKLPSFRISNYSGSSIERVFKYSIVKSAGHGGSCDVIDHVTFDTARAISYRCPVVPEPLSRAVFQIMGLTDIEIMTLTFHGHVRSSMTSSFDPP